MRVSLFLDHACNLRCRYCYNGPKFSRVMPLDVARRGVELAFSGRAEPRVSFFGGEPLLHMDLLQEITALARERARILDRRMGFLVVTNGTLLTGDTLRWFLDNRVYIGISLDGTKAAHDATRPLASGGSSWQAACDAVRAVVEARKGAGLRVIAVMDPANVDEVPDSFSTLVSLGIRNLSMNLNYEATWGDAERDRFVRALRGLGDRYVEAYRRAARDGRDPGFHLNLLDGHILTRVKSGYSSSDRCDFGCEEVAVSPRGRLYPCDRLVGEDTRDDVVIGDVWQGIDAARRDALVAEKNRVLEDCATCALQPRCMHWCGCVNYAMTGRVGEVAGLLCWFEQRILEEADRCASTLFKEGNQAFMNRFYAPRAPRPDGGWSPEGDPCEP